jgi:ABC-type phosphate transport system substrate-binding protein
MKHLIKYTLCAAVTLFSIASYAEVLVVVHPSNESTFDSNQIKRIYLGKVKSFSNGNIILPVNQDPSVVITGEFSSKALKKSSSQLKAYWSKLVFSGKGTPPKEVSGDGQVMKLVANNPDSIGYIDSASLDDSVKVVAKY